MRRAGVRRIARFRRTLPMAAWLLSNNALREIGRAMREAT
jgi:hypothetical protein